MFATPFTAPLHETLASHVFGRLAPQRVQSAVNEPVIAPVQLSQLPEDESFPDLAQRVRDVGEW
jgi:hypothetical protein